MATLTRTYVIKDIQQILVDLRLFKEENPDLPLSVQDKINDALNDLTFIYPYLT